MQNSRRQFIRLTSISGLGLGYGLSAKADSLENQEVYAEDEQSLYVGDKIAVTDTVHGKVRGFILNHVYTFLGIPYGADTGGRNRFMPPKSPPPWKNVYPALWWGDSAPQDLANRYKNPYSSFVDHWNYEGVSEDCLRVNVWTPEINGTSNRPVIVWLHGGGFTAGNAIEQDGYHGENLSRKGDVVFCSLNHRLNAFGFSDFSEMGAPGFEKSGNVGMLDIVLALNWVQQNISNFGGDPNNVCLMGQSGGATKITSLMAMPKAKNLFHKAVLLSGGRLTLGDNDLSSRIANTILKEGGIGKGQIRKLQEMSWDKYLSLSSSVITKIRQESYQRGNHERVEWGPVVDGLVIPKHPFEPDAIQHVENIPTLICSTLNESAPGQFSAEFENMSLKDVQRQLEKRYGEETGAIVNAYAQCFPRRKPIEIWSMILSNRSGAIALANRKAKQNASVFLAWFAWQPPLFNNRLRAFHCSDICFWLYNTDRMLSHTGGGKRPRELSDKMVASLLSFVRNGSPLCSEMPEWKSYSPENGETMILDDKSILVHDPDRQARKIIENYKTF
nr:carboxylesterase family protein [uncultured Draconibacterium sp.]